MYTASILKTEKNDTLSRFIVTAQFIDGATVITKDFQFSLTDTEEVIKRTLKTTLDELNAPTPVIKVGTIDLTPPPVVAPIQTPAEVAQEEWLTAYRNLEKAQKLAKIATDAGRPIDPARKAEMDKLDAFVDANFLNEYLSLI